MKIHEVALVVETSVPPRYVVYPTTPMLSLDAFQLSVIDVAVEPTFARFGGALGAVVSGTGHAAVDAAIVAGAERFPAASKASTENV